LLPVGRNTGSIVRPYVRCRTDHPARNGNNGFADKAASSPIFGTGLSPIVIPYDLLEKELVMNPVNSAIGVALFALGSDAVSPSTSRSSLSVGSTYRSISILEFKGASYQGDFL
jgi:hypothetical protein